MSARPASVVKVGGSLAGDPARLRAVLADLAGGGSGPVAVVPGGGAFADAVRVVQGRLGLDDGLAHRLALDAMGAMAEVFAALEPRLPVLTDLDALRARLAGGESALWDPGALRAGHPDIPETWALTADSLALWLAAALAAERCVLLKSVPVPPGAGPEALAAAGIVDAAFPAFAAAYAGGIVLRGPGETP